MQYKLVMAANVGEAEPQKASKKCESVRLLIKNPSLRGIVIVYNRVGMEWCNRMTLYSQPIGLTRVEMIVWEDRCERMLDPEVS